MMCSLEIKQNDEDLIAVNMNEALETLRTSPFLQVVINANTNLPKEMTFEYSETDCSLVISESIRIHRFHSENWWLDIYHDLITDICYCYFERIKGHFINVISVNENIFGSVNDTLPF